MSAADDSGPSIDLDCGIAYRRIRAWLDDELHLTIGGDCKGGDCWVFTFEGDSCFVHAQPLESRAIGAVNLERTHVVATGNANALAAFEKAFTLRFISAGG